MTMKKLIITADDYGMSPAVNQAIDEGIAAGLITSTNVMMNMPVCNEAVRLKGTGASVGLHWVLSCGKPVLPREQIPSLVAENGEFYEYPEFRARYRKGLIRNEDVERELLVQYEKFVDLIGEPDYWNTHQNVHVDFNIYALFVDIAAGMNIRRMRSHQRIYVPGSGNSSDRSLVWRLTEPLKARMLDCWQGNAHKKGIASPEGLIVALNRADTDRPEYLFPHIRWGRHALGEYVIHPAAACDSPYFGQISEKRIREYRLFTAETTRRVLEDCGIGLVGYDAL